jgi:hypothetical protein
MNVRPAFDLRVRLVPQTAVRAWPLWREAFAGLLKDHRYHELVADTLGFDCRVLVVEDADGTVLALQSCFFVEQDLVATAPVFLRRAVDMVRRIWPGFLKLRMLMIGCAAGEGDLTAPGHFAEIARALPAFARENRASIIVWKDLPASHRAAMEPVRTAFSRIASMPATVLPLAFTSFDDYLARTVSHVSRKNLRRKFRALAAAPPLEMTATKRIGDVVDEAHALYLQVFHRSSLQFEKLTREFLLGLGERLGDRARFFLWRQDGRLVAVSICLVHDGVLHDEYLGLDYAVALDLHLYFVTFRDVLTWAIAEGLSAYASTPLNYEPKLHLGFQLSPLDLYVAPTARWARPLLRLALPFLEPTRAEPALRRFPGVDALH